MIELLEVKAGEGMVYKSRSQVVRDVRNQRILNNIDSVMESVYARYDQLDNRRTDEAYFLLSLHDRFSRLKDAVDPTWRHWSVKK